MTEDDLAKSYARRIRSAKGSRGSLMKAASARHHSVRAELLDVFKDLDQKKDTAGYLLDEDTKDRVLRLLDGVLRVRPGNLKMIKKGSVEQSIIFDQQCAQLAEEIDFVD